ncbi:MAG: hypothetical protein IPL53_09785 [Ignavibacteria bacterium]|nr:hypothetical protein [Ignavibacteria bacterium]
MMYGIFLFFALNFFGWIVDDLYIYFRYVNNFVDGKGIVYNPGEYVEGFSGFSWLMLLSVFGFFGLPLELLAKITSLLFGFLNLLLLFRICLKLNLGRLSYLTCLLMLFNLPYILWSVSGFEIMLYVFLMLSAFYLIINLNTGTIYISILSLLIFLISVTRPEGILISLAFIVFTFVFSGNNIFAKKVTFLFGLMIVSFLMFRILYFGDILPNTYYAKIGHDFIGHYEIRSYRNGLYYIWEFFRHNIQFIPVMILLPLAYTRLNKNKPFYFILTIISLQLFFVTFAGGDWMVQYRFIVAVIPFLSLVLVICLNEYIILKKLSAGVIYTVAGSLIVMMTYSFIIEDKSTIQKETVMWNGLKEFSSDIKNTIPPGSYVANGSSGIIPYYLNDVIFLDVVGLTNKTIAKNGFRHKTWFEKSLPEYVFSKNPEWIIMWKRKNNDGVYTFESASPCYMDLAENENFRKYTLIKSYDVYDDTKTELYKLK